MSADALLMQPPKRPAPWASTDAPHRPATGRPSSAFLPAGFLPPLPIGGGDVAGKRGRQAKRDQAADGGQPRKAFFEALVPPDDARAYPTLDAVADLFGRVERRAIGGVPTAGV